MNAPDDNKLIPFWGGYNYTQFGVRIWVPNNNLSLSEYEQIAHNRKHHPDFEIYKSFDNKKYYGEISFVKIKSKKVSVFERIRMFFNNLFS